MARTRGRVHTMLLSDLVDEYVTSIRKNGYAANTIRQRERAARQLLASVGNIQTHNLTEVHIDAHFAKRQAAGISPGTLNLDLVCIRHLLKFAAQRRVVRRDVLAHRRPFRDPEKARRRVPVERFADLLDAAKNPRDRAVVAIGLYLMLRQSEIIALKVGDVDLTAGTVNVAIKKSGKVDTMPISVELDRELRGWFTHYQIAVGGNLDPSWYLVPARKPPGLTDFQSRTIPEGLTLYPTRRITHPERIVQHVLRACGYDVQEREGVHTLRRSAARALFDILSEAGHDQALRRVQAVLHHSSQTTTEHYLGVEIDKRHRDAMIRGKELFPSKDGGPRSKEREDSADNRRHGV